MAITFSRGAIPCLISLLVFLTGCETGSIEMETEATVEKPNIIYIMADDLGYGDLGVYGQEKIKTPNIDRLAAEGIRFTNFYAGSTVCAPSRAVLMTGLHTGHAPVRGNREIQPMGQQPLPDSTVTLAEVLKSVGYTTGLIGKWGLGGPETEGAPNNQGFDYFFGYLCQRHAHNYYPEFLFRNNERVTLEGNRVAEPRPDGAGVAIEKAQYSHDLFAQEALDFIEQNREGPFFLYLALTIPHANNEAGDEGMEVPDFSAYESESWPEQEKRFAAMVSRMDGDVGRIVDKLNELGIAERTIIFFTSDNGPQQEGGRDPDFFDSNGPFRGIKRDLYDGGIRVPMIVRGAGVVGQGVVSEHVGYFTDILPTLAELANAQIPANDGISFVPVLRGQETDQRRHDYLYWEFYEGDTGQAVRMGQWKGVRIPMYDGEIELYDVVSDSSEEHNVAADHPEVVERIAAIMEVAHVPSPIWQRSSN